MYRLKVRGSNKATTFFKYKMSLYVRIGLCKYKVQGKGRGRGLEFLRYSD